LAELRLDISISLDGYVAGPDPSEENPLGIGGEQLHEWALPLEAWRRPHGLEGGEVNRSSEVMEETQANPGATVMGRNMFGGEGSWDAKPWEGWWGDEPPFHMPVFVLTHHDREPLVKDGGTTFTFVTDGIESASSRRSRRPKRLPAARTSVWRVARTSPSSSSERGSSTRCSCTSCRCSSEEARGCSTTSRARTSSSSAFACLPPRV